MAADEAEFIEVLGHETVDLDRLRDICFYGVPTDAVRAQAWQVLLESMSPGAVAVATVSAAASAAPKAAARAPTPTLSPTPTPTPTPMTPTTTTPPTQASASSAPTALATPAAAPTTLARATSTTTTATTAAVTATATATAVGSGRTSAKQTRQQPQQQPPQQQLLFLQHNSLTYLEFSRLLKTEVSRLQRRSSAFRSAKLQKRVLSLVHDYVRAASEAAPNQSWGVQHGGLVFVAAPFALLLRKESEASASLKLMLRALDGYFGDATGRTTLGRFLMLFRSKLPELFTHFEEEDVEPSRWAGSWLQWLLCRELPFDAVLRLWDSYLAAPDGHGFELHTFVCLAILENCQLELAELEHGEILTFLHHLPTLDMDRIIVQAQYLAHDFRNH